MATASIVVVRVNADSYRLDRTEPAVVRGAVAFIVRVRDRLGNPLGWRLKPLVVMHGAKSRIWTSPAEAITTTKLMTPGQARTAVTCADETAAASAQARAP